MARKIRTIRQKSHYYSGFAKEDFHDAETDIEIMVQIRAFDEVFANTVVQKTSYINSEIIYGAKFIKMYESSEDHKTTILDSSKLMRMKK